MEPYEKTKAIKETEHAVREYKNATCKNAIISTIEPEVENYMTKEFKYTWSNTGCGEKRRSGSAYCQLCSDKHNK